MFSHILRYHVLRRTFTVFDLGKVLAHFFLVAVPREFSMNLDLTQPCETRRLARPRWACPCWKFYVAAAWTVLQIQLIMDVNQLQRRVHLDLVSVYSSPGQLPLWQEGSGTLRNIPWRQEAWHRWGSPGETFNLCSGSFSSAAQTFLWRSWNRLSLWYQLRTAKGSPRPGWAAGL